MEQRLSLETPGFVSVVTIAETAWVLDRAYSFTDYEIAGAIEGMLQTDVLIIENEQEVFAAMTALKKGYGAFADALIALHGSRKSLA